MNQKEKRIYLIKSLLSQHKEYENMQIPTDLQNQKRLLRALLNIRMPEPISNKF